MLLHRIRTPLASTPSALAASLLAGALWLVPAPDARAQDDDEFSFELEEIDPEEEARRAALRERLMRPTSYVDLGVWWNSRDDFKWGDFIGHEDSGFDVLAGLDLDFRAPWDAELPWYARTRGQNLGLRSRFVSGEYGIQGLVGLEIQYDEIPHYETESFFTPYQGTGGTNLTLPGGWVRAAQPSGFPTLAADLRSQDIQHERENLRTSLSLVLPLDLEMDFKWRREVKDGVKITAGVFGSNGGNPRAALLPEPVDYTTDQGDVTLRWGNETGQVELGYHVSLFNQHDETLTWENAFLPVGSWDDDPSLGRKGTAPDNQFHQIRLSGGVQLPFTSRFTLDAARGWMIQDETFLPFTINQDLSAPIPLPNSDFDGRIESTIINARFDSRPIERLRFRTSLRYDDRNNESGRDVYLYVPGDVVDQGTITDGTARLNRPYSYKLIESRTDVTVDLGWRTKIFGGYEYEEIERDYSEVDQTHEHITRVGLRSQPIRQASLRVEWEHAERFGKDYDGQDSFLAGLSPAHIATLGPAMLDFFENHPLLRRPFLTDRDRDRYTAALQLMPHEMVQFAFSVDVVDDDFEDTTIGLLRRRGQIYSADVSVFPCADLALHAFYTYEDYRTKQRGHSFRGFAAAADQANLDRRWLARDTDAVDTAGAGFDWTLLDGRIELDGDYVYTRAKGTIDTSTISPPLASSDPNFPDAETHLHGATVGARFRLTDALSFRLGYYFEKLDVDDWAFENVEPATVNNVLLDGRRETEYTAHLIGLSMRFEYR